MESCTLLVPASHAPSAKLIVGENRFSKQAELKSVAVSMLETRDCNCVETSNTPERYNCNPRDNSQIVISNNDFEEDGSRTLSGGSPMS